MEKFKNFGIGFLAAIGLLSLLTQATSEPNYGTPPSHVWEIHTNPGAQPQVYTLNKATGEVRKMTISVSKTDYVVMEEKSK